MMQIYKYLTINTVAEMCCLLIASFTLRSDKERIWRYFPSFILIALLAELSSIYLRTHGFSRTNWVYNIYGIFEISFITLMLVSLLKNKIKNWIPFFVGISIVIVCYLWDTIDNGIHKRYDLTNTIFGVFVVINSLYYLKLLMEDEKYVSLSTDPNFWWIMGAIFFYFAYTSLNILHSQLIIVPKAYNPLFRYTYQALNIILYILWSYSFICRKWNRTS